jgi:RNA 3'-terminal phosphate cyclase (ATP)
MVLTGGDPIVIDGSYGEGGGQIVRSSLSLAMITGVPFRLVNIRKGRKKPGLRPQHLTAVKACGSVCNARVSGVELGSLELSFTPRAIRAGKYNFRIGTAGSATLVLQTILLPLTKAMGESHLVVGGGTHVPWSPPFHYFAEVFLPTIERLGNRGEVALNRWGWYPRGGGEIEARIKPQGPSEATFLNQPFELKRISGISASSGLPEHIRVRQKKRLQGRLRETGIEAEISLMDVVALNPGSFVFVCVQGKESVAGFSALGARGKPAEQVASEAADALFNFLDTGAALDKHMADQILIYLARLPGEQQFATSSITQHLLTNAWVIEHFLPVQFEVTAGLGEPGMVVKRDR